MTPDQKQNLNMVLQQFTNNQLSYDLVGIWNHMLNKLLSDPRTTMCKVFFDTYKEEQIKNKHSFTSANILNILFNTNSHKPICVLRDINHERLNPVKIICIDGITRYESRWNRYYVDRFGKIYKVVYNIRVHQQTKDTVLGIISTFDVPKADAFRSNLIRSKYKQVVDSFKGRLISEQMWYNFYKNYRLLEEAVDVKYKNIVTNELLDLSVDDLSHMTKEMLLQLEGVNDFDDSTPMLLHTLSKFTDSMKLDKFYDKNDIFHDPTGFLREDYISRFDMEPINEENLLEFGNTNINIFNELLDMKYAECGGIEVINDDYAYDHWKQFYPAKWAVAYGHDQNDIYDKLCAAFGKEKVDTVWCKHYRGKDDGLIK